MGHVVSVASTGLRCGGGNSRRQKSNEWAWPCASETYLGTLEFEFSVSFVCHETSFFFGLSVFNPSKMSKLFLVFGPQMKQNRWAGQIWPMDYSLPTVKNYVYINLPLPLILAQSFFNGMEYPLCARNCAHREWVVD